LPSATCSTLLLPITNLRGNGGGGVKEGTRMELLPGARQLGPGCQEAGVATAGAFHLLLSLRSSRRSLNFSLRML
jgi:hypothetical protein